MKSIIKQAKFIGVLAIASFIIQACDGPSAPSMSNETTPLPQDTVAKNNCVVYATNSITGQAHPSSSHKGTTRKAATIFMDDLKKATVKSQYNLTLMDSNRSGYDVIKAIDKDTQQSIILPKQYHPSNTNIREAMKQLGNDQLWKKVTIRCN